MPGVGLNRERILDAAQAIADAEGPAALTLTAVADRVGVRKPSLYKHVDGLPAIEEGLAERCFRGLAAAVTDSGDLVELARRWRDFARRHPGLYAMGQPARAARSEIARGAAEEALAALFHRLGAVGVEGDAAVHAARALRALVHGFVELERTGAFGLPASIDASFERALAALLVGLGHDAPPEAPRARQGAR